MKTFFNYLISFLMGLIALYLIGALFSQNLDPTNWLLLNSGGVPGKLFIFIMLLAEWMLFYAIITAPRIEPDDEL